MDARIVIAFRAASDLFPGAGNHPSGSGFLERARALAAKVSSHGGEVVAWDAERIAFSLDDPDLRRTLDVVAAALGERSTDGRSPWAVGIASGALERLDPTGASSLGWGPPLVAAMSLATAARPGELVCAQNLRQVRSGELLVHGTRLARSGALRFRGARVDPACPWRREAVEALARMRVAPVVGRDVPTVRIVRESITVLRADPGAGGTRILGELASRTPRALLIAASGVGLEPLGSVRRALTRAVEHELPPPLRRYAERLDSLFAGEGLSIEDATDIVSAYLGPSAPGGPLAAILIDDARAIDPSSVEVCVRVAGGTGGAGLVVRLDETDALPSVLAAAAKTVEVELPPLGPEASEKLVDACTNGALDALARKRWARLGGGMPLAIVEAVAWGLAAGEIVLREDGSAHPRTRASGRGKVRPATAWIRARAATEAESGRRLLALLALLGGEAKLSRLVKILDAAGHRFDVEAMVEHLARSRWLVDTQADWIGLPSRTYQAALSALLEPAEKQALHRAAADVIESEEGAFGRASGAWHAAEAGDAARAARILLAAASAAADAGLETSTTHLIAYARRIDPSCEERALELLSSALSHAHSLAPRQRIAPAPKPRVLPPPPRVAPPSVVPPPAPTRRSYPPMPSVPRVASAPLPRPPSVPSGAIAVQDSVPPTIATPALDPEMADAVLVNDAAMAVVSDRPPPTEAGATIATRLGELAKEALLAGDNVSLERWVDGLRASGESPVFTERMQAMARLVRGDIGDALRVLRRTRAQLAARDHAVRCQTSLALGIALSVAGRPDEALLEGLDALARARQGGDEKAEDACLAFLAKLFASVGRRDGAAMLGAARR